MLLLDFCFGCVSSGALLGEIEGPFGVLRAVLVLVKFDKSSPLFWVFVGGSSGALDDWPGHMIMKDADGLVSCVLYAAL